MPIVGTIGAASARGFGLFGRAKPDVLLNGSPISTNTYVYNNANTVNTLQVTGGPVVVTFRVWGAAGGGGSYSSTFNSGSGGYAKGTITLQPGTTYYLYVGDGGNGPSSTAGNGGLGGWPNGGYGTRGDASGAGGGGMSMVSTAIFSTGMSNTNILLIAGGGGGTTGFQYNAGAGGGTSGENSSGGSGQGGRGATQSSGGTFNGAYLTGGNATGQRTSGTDDGGGGGGGYYGGGGGTSDATAGGGGSGYYNPSLVSSPTLETGVNKTPPDPDGLLPNTTYAYGNTSIGGTPQKGNPGIMYLTFTI